MKLLLFFINIIFTINLCNAQNNSRLISENLKPNAGMINKFYYEPAKNLVIPEKIEAMFIYKSGEQFISKLVAIRKINKVYEFSYKIPDSISVIIIGIVDANKKISDYNGLSEPQKKIIDNNNDEGYIFTIHNKKKINKIKSKIELAELLNNYAPYILDIKRNSNYIIEIYEQLYKSSPKLKNDNSYLDYLILLYQNGKNKSKINLENYAIKKDSNAHNEMQLLTALKAYKILKLDQKIIELENKVLLKYSNGEFAKQKFWNNFYSNSKSSEQAILENMNNFIEIFDDSSSSVKDKFYIKIITLFLEQSNWESLLKYENLITNKYSLEFILDNFAWKLSGKSIEAEGRNLDFAKRLSQKSLEYLEERKKQIELNDDESYRYFGALNKYLNTYSLILFKQGLYDSAFYYQNEIYLRGGIFDANSTERYLAYAAKVKEVSFAKEVLEIQLQKGISSPKMKEQLKVVYQKLNLSSNEFLKFFEKSKFNSQKLRTQKIVSKLGTTIAKKFSLKNMDGKLISLSSFKDKIVIIDFWATWCIPCKSSFPDMQELINKYKSDSNVIFLFINTWENKTPEKIRTIVSKFIKENEYTFTILFDDTNEVVNKYKVDGIPAHFVIDKTGNIISMEDSIEKLDSIINTLISGY